jgi:hypothetical protein
LDIGLPCPKSPLKPAISSTDVQVTLTFADIEFATFTTQSFSYYCGDKSRIKIDVGAANATVDDLQAGEGKHLLGEGLLPYSSPVNCSLQLNLSTTPPPLYHLTARL